MTAGPSDEIDEAGSGDPADDPRATAAGASGAGGSPAPPPIVGTDLSEVGYPHGLDADEDDVHRDPHDPVELQGHPLLDVGDISGDAEYVETTPLDAPTVHDADLHLGLTDPLDLHGHPLVGELDSEVDITVGLPGPVDLHSHPLHDETGLLLGAASHAELDPTGLHPLDPLGVVAAGEEPPGLQDQAPDLPVAPVRVARASRWSGRDRERERELLRLVASLPPEDPERLAARDELITMHLPLAHYLARRFRDRGEPLEDLQQVATIGLVKSVDRFSLDRGVEFSTFATPTIVGEIKRHFRDKGWAIRVPRRLQELRLSIAKATNELSQTGQGSPTVAEIAAYLGISQDEVLEGLESAQAYAAISLDAASSEGDEENMPISDVLGELDPNLGHVDNQATVHPLLATLAPRERRILELRFYQNMTQAQIAEQIGVSQMHVSRLLARSLAELRENMTE